MVRPGTQLKIVVCAFALASLPLFTSCGVDDTPDPCPNDPPRQTNTGPYGPQPPVELTGSFFLTLANNPAAAHVTEIDILPDNSYLAKFSDNTTETGPYIYVPNGDTATLILTTDSASTTTIFTLTYTCITTGSYVTDAGDRGTFTLVP
jgi:hypothetical protein